ncbi:NnrS family protein [Aidingimonas lacisalsi]|uniref:NnrS family protein n=1 Tax=Aidingimonas lacisalsi TaxID=2604086 RepID=UPI0011D22F7C|nr:NnrS family protein [Aidingimonas lacisalsi]
MTSSFKPVTRGSIERVMPLWRLAFRPFFLLGAVFSLVAMLVWGGFWHGEILLMPHGGMLWWHQHEMLFGFGGAIVVGFLLTAVQNWTGRPGLHGGPLCGLVMLWLAGRVLLAFPPDMAPIWPALVDLVFLPLAAVALGISVIRVRQWRNLIFIPVLLLMTTANGWMHWGAIQANGQAVRDGAQMAILLMVLLMVVLGGRVIPFFTSRRLGTMQPSRWLWLEIVSIGTIALLVLMSGIGSLTSLPAETWAIVALTAAAANTLRLCRWQGLRCLHEPLLWGLHGSYAFVCLGLAMWGLASFGWLGTSLALHAITIGGMSTMMLAMMARVSLGHTGRAIRTLPGIGVALGLMMLAAVLRALLPVIWPQLFPWTLSLSVLCWVLAFTLFVWRYARLLATPRADGQAG